MEKNAKTCKLTRDQLDKHDPEKNAKTQATNNKQKTRKKQTECAKTAIQVDQVDKHDFGKMLQKSREKMRTK